MRGKIPRSFIDDLLNRVDIVELINNRVPLKKKGREYWACCPFHQEKSASFSVSQTKQFYHCFGCHQHGNALSFLMDYEQLEFIEAVEELARHVGVEVVYENTGKPQQRKTDVNKTAALYDLLENCSVYYQKQLRDHPPAIDYLKNRGINGETAKRFALGYAPAGWNNLQGDPAQLLETGMQIRNDSNKIYDRFRERIMFPIRDRRGRTIAFGGRIIDPEHTPKYLNSPETPVFHKGEEIYGLFELRQQHNRIEQVIITEGYMDVVALSQHGIHNAVATLGTAINQQQVEKLFRTAAQLVFCFDADNAGRKAAWRALENSLESLNEGRITRFLFLPDGHDPDSFVRENGAERFTELAANATTLSEYLVQQLIQQGNLQSPEGKAALLDQLRPYFQRIPLASLKNQILEILEKRLNMQLDQRLQQVLGHNASENQPATVIPEAHWTPVRLAINLLLQQPSLALSAGNLEDLSNIDIPGIELLFQLLDRIHEEPDISPQNLLSRFEGHPNEQHLYKIATMTPAMLEGEQAIEPMFQDAINRLKPRFTQQRFQKLQQKLMSGINLDDEEIEEYRSLINQKSKAALSAATSNSSAQVKPLEN